MADPIRMAPDPLDLLRRARSYLPDHGPGIDTYDAQRMTAFATLAIAEMLAQGKVGKTKH